MQIHQDINPEAITIRRYHEGVVHIVHPVTERDAEGKPIVNRQQLTHSAIIMGNQLIEDWPVSTFESLDAQHMKVLQDLQPEVILVGTGDRLRFPPPDTAQQLLASGIGVEYMDVGAACRTYNILSAEGREVAVALILEES